MTARLALGDKHIAIAWMIKKKFKRVLNGNVAIEHVHVGVIGSQILKNSRRAARRKTILYRSNRLWGAITV